MGDASSVTNMVGMFYETTEFNGDVSKWDVSSVTNMDDMFYEAKKFNGDVSEWDVSSVTSMVYMFNKATKFNSQICIRNLDVKDITEMFTGSSCSLASCITCDK